MKVYERRSCKAAFLSGALSLVLLLFLPSGAAYGQGGEQGRWSVALNAGIPFFWGDMNSVGYDRTYTGYMAGVQATRQFSPTLGLSLSVDYARNHAGARSYNRDYLLDRNATTYYTPQPFPTQSYEQSRSRIGMLSVGISADVTVNRFLTCAIANYWPKLIVSPGVYLLSFNSLVEQRATGESWADDGKGPVCPGLGCAVCIRQRISRPLDIQLRGTGTWITDNRFDGVVTEAVARQNAMWSVGAGIVWYVGSGNYPRSLIYKSK